MHEQQPGRECASIYGSSVELGMLEKVEARLRSPTSQPPRKQPPFRAMIHLAQRLVPLSTMLRMKRAFALPAQHAGPNRGMQCQPKASKCKECCSGRRKVVSCVSMASRLSKFHGGASYHFLTSTQLHKKWFMVRLNGCVNYP